MGSWGSDEGPPYKSLHRLKEKYIVTTEKGTTTQQREEMATQEVLSCFQ